MAGVHEANSPLKAGSAGFLSDSCLISPPTHIRLDETPCQYFLRGKGRFASTPLLSWEQSDNESGVNDAVKIDFNKRLDIYENDVNDFYPQLPQEIDSGKQQFCVSLNAKVVCLELPNVTMYLDVWLPDLILDQEFGGSNEA